MNLRKIVASMGKKTHLIPVNVVYLHYIILLTTPKLQLLWYLPPPTVEMALSNKLVVTLVASCSIIRKN